MKKFVSLFACSGRLRSNAVDHHYYDEWHPEVFLEILSGGWGRAGCRLVRISFAPAQKATFSWKVPRVFESLRRPRCHILPLGSPCFFFAAFGMAPKPPRPSESRVSMQMLFGRFREARPFCALYFGLLNIASGPRAGLRGPVLGRFLPES